MHCWLIGGQSLRELAQYQVVMMVRNFALGRRTKVNKGFLQFTFVKVGNGGAKPMAGTKMAMRLVHKFL